MTGKVKAALDARVNLETKVKAELMRAASVELMKHLIVRQPLLMRVQMQQLSK